MANELQELRPDGGLIDLKPHQLYDRLDLSAGTELIRVLVVWPNAQDASSLQGDLRVIDLKTSPRFDALSYVWGSGMTHSITCNQFFEIPITKNCHDALLSLVRVRGTLAIWVDAICINQDDDAEKAQQINLMRDIYSWANTVYIWLGSGSSSTASAIAEMELSARQVFCRPDCPWRREEGSHSLKWEQLSYYASTFPKLWRFLIRSRWHRRPEHPVESSVETGIREFLTADWIRRAWTFQEIILASHPVLVCGDHTIEWSKLQHALINWRLNSTVMDDSQEMSKLRLMLAPWRQMQLIRRSIERSTTWNGRVVRGLPSRLHGKGMCSIQQCQMALEDPRRTHIFLCFTELSIASSLLLSGTITGMVITLHANSYLWFAWLGALCILTSLAFTCFCSTWGAFAKVEGARFAGDAASNQPPVFGIIAALRDRKAGQAPDKVNALIGVLRQLGIGTADPLPIGPSKPYTTTALARLNLQQLIHLLEWQNSLVGLILDSCGSLPDVPSWVPDWTTTENRAWWTTADVCGHSSNRPASLTDPFFSISPTQLAVGSKASFTITSTSGPIVRLNVDANLDSEDGQRQLTETVAAFRRWFGAMAQDPSALPTTDLPGVLVHDAIFIPSDDSEQPKHLSQRFEDWWRTISSSHHPTLEAAVHAVASQQEVLNTHVEICTNVIEEKRGLFLSLDGFIGSGPPQMAAGDRVVSVHGCSWPLVLRPIASAEDERYTVIGPAYVLGEMRPYETSRRIVLF